MTKEAYVDISHETFLNDLVKDVIDKGCAVIEVRLLLRWFDRRNWGKAIWQSLNQRFLKELTERGQEKDGWQLWAIPGDQRVALLCFDPKDAMTDKGWWRRVEKLI